MEIEDIFYVDADSVELGLEDYDVRVCTNVKLLESPDINAEKIFVCLEEIDVESNVWCYINKKCLKERNENR